MSRSKAKLELIRQVKKAVANAYPEKYVNDIDEAMEDNPDEDRKEYHPIVEMALIAGNPRNDVDMRHAANKEVASYLFPKVKTIEMDSANGEGLVVQIVNFGDSEKAVRVGAEAAGRVIEGIVADDEEDEDVSRIGHTVQ